MDEFFIILFHSTNNAMWAAKTLKNEGIDRKMIPIPRHMSSDCGYCIRINKENLLKTEGLLNNKKIEYDRIEKL